MFVIELFIVTCLFLFFLTVFHVKRGLFSPYWLSSIQRGYRCHVHRCHVRTIFSTNSIIQKEEQGQIYWWMFPWKMQHFVCYLGSMDACLRKIFSIKTSGKMRWIGNSMKQKTCYWRRTTLRLQYCSTEVRRLYYMLRTYWTPFC